MADSYQNLARRFRPQTFSDVVGQDRIVTTLKNALASKRVSHAYLFCGNRGSGKTTLARIFAKALHCTSPEEGEPCNQCQSCIEITNGSSLDVIEIDGASNRGIDDIRHINETVGYAPSSGRYKIYIIDEVHMLTKEAFNALLKTLEEPPKNVKFFFATTEPHKVLPTIISRCQRFDLKRIGKENIRKKLKSICIEVERDADEKALDLIANVSDGSLRDAESFLDQLLCFEEGPLREKNVASALGITTIDELFRLDEKVFSKETSFAFTFTEKLYEEGKDFAHFIEELMIHYRNHLSALLQGREYGTLLYTQEELLFLLDLLMETKSTYSKTSVQRIHLETLLLKILRLKNRVSIDSLIDRLTELEKQEKPRTRNDAPEAPVNNPIKSKEAPLSKKIPETPKEESSSAENSELAQKNTKIEQKPLAEEKKDPKLVRVPFCEKNYETIPSQKKTKAEYDTLFRFAAVELEGSINHYH